MSDTTPKYETPKQAEGDHIRLGDYWHAFLKRKWLILAIILGVLFITVVMTLRQPKIFQATATVEIDLQVDRVLNNVNDVYQLGDMSYWDSKSYFETQYKIILSDVVAAAVVDALHLDRDLAFLGLDKIEDEEELTRALKRVDPVMVLQANLSVDPVQESRLVRIHYRGTDPVLITSIANAVARAYIEQNLERKLISTRNALDWLDEQTGGLKTKLETSEQDLYRFMEANNILTISMDQRINLLGTRMADLSRETSQTESQLIKSRARYEALRKAMDSAENLENLANLEILRDPLVRDLKLTLEKLLRERAEAEGRYKDKHPDVLRLQAQVDRARANLRREIGNIVEAVRVEYESTRQTHEALTRELDLVKDQAREMTLREVEYNRLLRERDLNQRLFEQVIQRLREVDLSGMLKINNIRMLDEAKIPKTPVYPRVKLNIVVGLMLGLLLALGVALVLEMLDTTIKNQDDITRHLGVPLLGIIPRVRRDTSDPRTAIPNAADIYSFLYPKSAIAECCRQVRTNLNFMSPGKPLRRILVTSSSPREGKTAIASNLSITLAQSGKRILVVDTDMRRPRIHKAFGMTNEYGLSNIIMGLMTEQEAIRSTEIENLSVLTCGPIPPNPAELIGSDTFAAIVDRLSGSFDWIVFDSPPVVAVTDALVLSRLVDGVVMVVKFGSTLRDVAAQARSQLAGVKARLLGAVINDLDLENRQYDHYYYYYYNRYGYYYGEREGEDAASGKRRRSSRRNRKET